MAYTSIFLELTSLRSFADVMLSSSVLYSMITVLFAKLMLTMHRSYGIFRFWYLNLEVANSTLGFSPIYDKKLKAKLYFWSPTFVSISNLVS